MQILEPPLLGCQEAVSFTTKVYHTIHIATFPYVGISKFINRVSIYVMVGMFHSTTIKSYQFILIDITF